MRRAWLVAAITLGSACIDYELNPDAGFDAGVDGGEAEGIDGGSETPDGGEYAFPDAGWVPLPDAGAEIAFCDPNGSPNSKRRCIPISTPGEGEPVDPQPGWPGSMQNGDPGAAVLFLLRIERGTVNLAERYASMVGEALAGLAMPEIAGRIRPGIQVSSYAVASLYTGEYLWTPASANTLTEAIIAAASVAAPMASRPCTVDALAQLARNLPTWPDASGSVPFSAPFSAFAVYLIDSGARPYSPDMAACAQDGLTAGDYFSADPATWLVNVEGRPLPRPQIRFLSLFTPEGITSAEAKALCVRRGMPEGTLDVIEASPVPFFGPFMDRLNAHSPGQASSVDLCVAYSRFEEQARKFGRDFRAVLEQQPPWY